MLACWTALFLAQNNWRITHRQMWLILSPLMLLDWQKDHPFADGKKRTAFLALGLSLRLNGYRLTAAQSEATQTILLLAAGDISEEDLATWIRGQMTQLEG